MQVILQTETSKEHLKNLFLNSQWGDANSAMFSRSFQVLVGFNKVEFFVYLCRKGRYELKNERMEAVMNFPSGVNKVKKMQQFLGSELVYFKPLFRVVSRRWQRNLSIGMLCCGRGITLLFSRLSSSISLIRLHYTILTTPFPGFCMLMPRIWPWGSLNSAEGKATASGRFCL